MIRLSDERLLNVIQHDCFAHSGFRNLCERCVNALLKRDDIDVNETTAQIFFQISIILTISLLSMPKTIWVYPMEMP